MEHPQLLEVVELRVHRELMALPVQEEHPEVVGAVAHLVHQQLRELEVQVELMVLQVRVEQAVRMARKE